MLTILVICLFFIGYIYVGYPLIIQLLAGVAEKTTINDGTQKKCSVVIAVRDEGVLLKEKLRNLLASEDALIGEVLVGADGSTGISDVLVELNDPRIRVIEFGARRGKTAVLNDIAPMCAFEILVMMDARQRVEPGAIKALLSNFSDEKVGVVSGELVFKNSNETSQISDSAAAEGMGAYWRYEKWIRKNESRFASVPGATGACYAIKKALFNPIPPETLVDDVAIPMQAVMNGYRCVFETKAVVYDQPSMDTGQEAIRKRRTLAGNVQLLQLFPGLVLPWKNPICFQYVSHKVLRLFSPFLIILAGVLSVLGYLTENRPIFVVLTVFFGFFIIISLFGGILEKKKVKNRLFSLFWMFFVLNWVTFLGVVDGLRGKYRVKWDQAYEKE